MIVHRVNKPTLIALLKYIKCILPRRDKSGLRERRVKYLNFTHKFMLHQFVYLWLFIEHLVCFKHHVRCKLSISLPMLLIYLKVKPWTFTSYFYFLCHRWADMYNLVNYWLGPWTLKRGILSMERILLRIVYWSSTLSNF